MNKYNCGVIQDLLALYHDGVCNEESCRIVEEHLSQCDKCSSLIRQLDNSQLEADLGKQAQGILKAHKKRQRRKLLVAIAVTGGVLVLAASVVLFNIMQTCIEMNKAINQYLPDVGNSAEFFVEYDISDDSMAALETETMTIDIPADYVKNDIDNDIEVVCYYKDTDKEQNIIVHTTTYDLSGMNLFARDEHDTISDEEYERRNKYLTDWFAALGHGLPDSAYGVYKCMYLLDNDDRSFWNTGRNIAFGIMGVMKQELCGFGDEHYIYEAKDKCGIIRVALPNESRDTNIAVIDLFSPDDFNTAYTVMINSKSLDEIYAIVNSIRLK